MKDESASADDKGKAPLDSDGGVGSQGEETAMSLSTHFGRGIGETGEPEEKLTESYCRGGVIGSLDLRDLEG